MNPLFGLQRVVGWVVTSSLLFLTIKSAFSDENDFDARSIKLASGVELHYVEAGDGQPVVFIHGTLGDLYMWTDLGLVEEVSRGYRAIAYSRRYNFPNRNETVSRSDYGTLVEAEDLAAFLEELKINSCHIVGYSYGGYTALHFALEHPSKVTSLTLAEPPLVPWLRDLPNGPSMLEQREQNLVKPVNDMLLASNEEGALRLFINHVIGAGAYEEMGEAKKTQLRRNRRELFAALRSNSMFGDLKRQELKTLRVPTLMISGEKSIGMLRMLDDALEEALPAETVTRVLIPDSTHGMWHENPSRCKQVVMDFLAENS